ncbi:MAG: hypothetical protein ACOCTI_05000 [Phycisphaeraceae bacterium]
MLLIPIEIALAVVFYKAADLEDLRWPLAWGAASVLVTLAVLLSGIDLLGWFLLKGALLLALAVAASRSGDRGRLPIPWDRLKHLGRRGERDRYGPGHCPRCGYDLTGLQGRRQCPECGGELPHRRSNHIA